MFIYCISSGDYEQYQEYYFTHRHKYTKQEFDRMLNYSIEMCRIIESFYPGDLELPTYTELLCILYGFEEDLDIEVHIHSS